MLTNKNNYKLNTESEAPAYRELGTVLITLSWFRVQSSSRSRSGKPSTLHKTNTAVRRQNTPTVC